ncbi:MAG: Maf family protein [Thermoplasmatota archaeon]
MRITLASGSPRRSDILRRMGFDFTVVIPEVEESSEGCPAEIVVENARRKAGAVSETAGTGIVISADTVVVCGGEILGKPIDRDDAERMIRLQMDHPQEVYSGVCVIDVNRGKEFFGYEVSLVEMIKDHSVLEEYLDSDLWVGKAGAYGIQDRAVIEARVTRGEEDNVEGLPGVLLRRLLSLLDFRYPEKTPAGV